LLLSVVVPIHNEQESLGPLEERLSQVLDSLGEPAEVILVDDGSTDQTPVLMALLAGRDPRYKILTLSRNFGHQIAITAGLDRAAGEAIVIMDGDLQDPPEVIPELVAAWRDGYDVVYAVRNEREGETWARVASASVFYRLLQRITSTPIPRDAGDFRLLSRRAVDALTQMPERARFLRGMTSWIGFRQTGIAYDRDARYAGASKYSLPRQLGLALDAISSFSTTPIKAVTALGFALVVFCMAVLGWTLYVRFFTADSVQGWTSVIAVVLLLGGVQLLSLGVIGQYVARIFDETKGRPVYLVDEVVETVRESEPV
jgi:dolichol-phosphate mannosyltransferase